MNRTIRPRRAARPLSFFSAAVKTRSFGARSFSATIAPVKMVNLVCCVVLIVFGLGACVAPLFPPPPTPAPAPTNPPPTQETGPKLATPRPLELIFSAVQDTTSSPQPITLHNTGNAPLLISALSLTGLDQDAFALVAPPLPLSLAPGDDHVLDVSFVPTAPGTARAELELTSTDPGNARVRVGLYGLGSLGEQGENEPTLQGIVDTLGYDVAVGSSELRLGTGAEAVGDEVTVPLFERAGPGPVTLTVVARYGPETVFPYGFFTLGGATDAQGQPLQRPLRREVGLVAAEHAQRLLPPLEQGTLTFTPGDEVFGIYGQAGEGTQYSLDTLNDGLEHALRVYPLKDRNGTPVPDSFLIGLEEAQNGDYQDAVFVLGNVRGAGEPEPEPATEAAFPGAVNTLQSLSDDRYGMFNRQKSS